MTTDKINAKWLLNEANQYNKNNKISMYLVGTNSDKPTTFDKEDAMKFAQENGMTYLEVNCLNTNECEKIIKDSIVQICQNMDSKLY